MSLPSAKQLRVALSFAISGIAAWYLYQLDARGSSNDLVLAGTAAPFALLATALFWRNIRAIILVPLVIATWYGAFWSALVTTANTPHFAFFAMLVGGLVGGVGLSVCDCIGQLKVDLRRIGGVCISAVVAALPFGLWNLIYSARAEQGHAAFQSFLLAAAFAIWQAAVGTCLYSWRSLPSQKSPE